MIKKRELFVSNPELFSLICGVCGNNFIPTSYEQYKNLVAKAKSHNRLFYCSDTCKIKFRGTEKVNCEHCNKEFNVNGYSMKHRKQHFCSRNCWIKYRKEHKLIETKVSVCSYCNKEYVVGKASVGKYCSLRCQHDDAYKKYTDLIEQGVTVSHRILKNYLMKHNTKCMNPDCKWDWDSNSENNPTLELHHIDGIHTNNALDNCILLCPNCHSLTDNYKYKKKHKSTRKYRKKYNQYFKS